MSGLLGPKSQSTSEPKLNAIQVNQSHYGAAIPLVYGQCRIPMSMLWYDGFVAIPHTERQSGGKGGGGGVRSTTYTYTASVVLGLCEGPIREVGTVWKDKEQTTLAALGLTLFLGTSPQATWSHLSINFPSAAIPYDRTAFVAHSTFELGNSAAMPNLTFEVIGFAPYQIGTINDAEPAAILADYLADVHHGVGFGYLGTITGAGATTWETYCRAMGLFLSPEEHTQRPAHEFVSELLTITNSEAVWSAGLLRVVPRGDESVNGNGRTYTPDLTPLWNLTDADFLRSGDDDPITVERKAAADLYNIVRVEFLNRARQYNPEPAEARDELDIALNGERPAPTMRHHAIKDAAVARQVAQMYLQRMLYVRNSYRFRLPFDYSQLEPMDLVSLTDSRLGLSAKLVRVLEVEDNDQDELGVLAEEVPVGPAGAPRYAWQLAQGYAANYAASPGSVLEPCIFTAPPLLVSANDDYEIWIAVSGGAGGAWGGCEVWFSLDDLVYTYAGEINGPARYGTLGADINEGTDPDTLSTLRLELANESLQLGTGSREDADNNRLLLWVDGEVVSYQNAVLVSAGTYDVTYLRRHKFGSQPGAHDAGSKWARLDAAIFRMRYDPGLAGRTVYFKFTSRNVYGQAQQSLADAVAYPHTISREVSDGLLFKSNDTLAWDTDAYSSEGYFDGCALRFRALRNDGACMAGLNTDPTTDASYSSIDFAWYLKADGTCSIYESGAEVLTAGSYSTSTQFEVRHDAFVVQYVKDGVVVRAVPLVYARLFMDSSIYTPGAGFSEMRFEPLGQSGVRDGNLLNLAVWRPGINTFYSVGNFVGVHTSVAEQWLVQAGGGGAPLGPYGSTETLWECRPDSGVGAAGGFVNSGDLLGIDHFKSYRFVCWYRWNSVAQANSGAIYLGLSAGGETLELVSAGGGVASNPYAFGNSPAGFGLIADKWYLGVAVLHGSGYAGADSGIAGIYDPATGQRVVDGMEYRLASTAALQAIRCYPYDVTDTDARYWLARPRVDLMDGREPSIALLLSPSGALAYRNTVGTPQIDPNAATEVYSATATNVDVFTTTTSPAVNTLVASVSVPAQAYETEMVVTATGYVDHYAPSAQFNTSAAIADFSGTNIYGDPIARNASTASPDAKTSFAIEKRFNVPASTAKTFRLYAIAGAIGSVPGAYSDLNDVLLKVEVIKR